MKTIKDLVQNDTIYVLGGDGKVTTTKVTLIGSNYEVGRRLFLACGGAYSLYINDEWWCNNAGDLFFCSKERMFAEVSRQIKITENKLKNLKALGVEE